jgi:hypothetical protein
VKAEDLQYIERWEDLPKVSCESNSNFKELSIGANESSLKLNEKDKELIGTLINLKNPNFTDLNASSNIRIEGCLNGELFLTKRILVRNPYSSMFEIYIPESSTIQGVQQLYDKFISKNNKPIKLTIIRNDSDNYGYLLASTPSNPNVYFMSSGSFSGSQFNTNSLYVFVAEEIRDTNPFPLNPCVHGALTSSKFTVDQADFEISYCAYMGGGETTGYTIMSVTLIDHNPKIHPGASDKPIIFRDEKLKDDVQYKWNHHNACDSMVVKAKEYNAVYAFTAPAIAGCGAPIDGAPKRTFDDRRYGTLYQINYGATKGEIKESLFSGSYMFAH